MDETITSVTALVFLGSVLFLIGLMFYFNHHVRIFGFHGLIYNTINSFHHNRL